MLCTRKQKLETIINEVEYLQRLRYPHIIQLVGSYLQEKKFTILLYLVAQWNLAGYLEFCQDDIDPTARYGKRRALPGFLPCLAHALAYVHENTIKHMDIKPKTALVRSNKSSDDQLRVYL